MEKQNKRKKLYWSPSPPKLWGLTTQLFIKFLAFVFAFVLIMEMAVRYNFNTGFKEYVNDREQERISLWSKSLEKIYLTHDNTWDILRQDQDLWWRLMILNKEVPPNEPTLTQEPVPNPNPAYMDMINPDRKREAISKPFLALVSSDKQNIIAGFIPDVNKAQWNPLYFDGKNIGWLVTEKMKEEVLTGLDEQFASTQITNMLWITVIGCFLAAFFCYWISKTILKPIKALAKATHALAEGDYKSGVIVTERNDEFGQLAKDFNKMVQTIEGNEIFRKSMMADISHELRTPITIIKGELQAMLDGIRKPTNNNLEALLNDVENLNRLINDVYDIALMDAGGWKYNFSEVDLIYTMENVIQAFENRFQQKNLDFYFHYDNSDITIWADQHRITQLLTNLLENSYRYTNPNGRIVVKVYDSNKEVKISIKDSKPGVPDELLPNLFERFYRLESSRNKAYGGSGLGLTLCKGIVDKHQGFIEAERSEWDGLCLHVILPKYANKK